MKQWFSGLRGAAGMFCILPVPFGKWEEDGNPWIIANMPVVGLLLGLVWQGAFWVLEQLGSGMVLRGILLAMVPAFFTGFLHLDGFMDVSDALLSRREAEEKRRILKDPHTGAFAVLAAIFLVLVLCGSLAELAGSSAARWLLLIIPVASRCCSALALLHTPTMPGSGLGAYFKKGARAVHTGYLLVLLVLIGVASFFLLGLGGIVALAVGIAVFWLTMRGAVSQLGGINGDICGYSLALCEAATLLAVVLMKGVFL